MSSRSNIPDGALQCLLHSQNIDAQDIEQENEEEVESLLAGLQDINVPSRLQPETSMDTGAGTYQLLNVELHAVKKQRLDSSIMKKHLKKASEQVVVENTLQEYRRYWDQFTAFCTQMGFINGAEESDVEERGFRLSKPSGSEGLMSE
ncbi:hypothetical protein EVJ58_g6116 [Rhodofomes roseus]|uniref:Uncharacterized protein n=1 Tax=Rhodofomes roseus TaxID=34475 RepID=A0A4Y9Y8Q2_9APHY|nr:hypothetical protein EVJ58_g6116 [Rhodofomes roseus]